MKSRYEEYKALRDQGKTYQEIAEALGITREHARKYCEKHGLAYNQSEFNRLRSINATRYSLSDWNRKVKNRYGESVETISVNETGKTHERTLIIKCSKCETVKTISSITLRRKSQSCCEVCKKRADEVERQIKQLQEELRAEKYKTKKLIEENQIGFRFCECGATLDCRGGLCIKCKEKRQKEKRKEYTKRYTYKLCKDIWYKAERKRAERIKSTKRDADLTNKKLFERDKGICHLCGGLCDWNDGKWIGGVFYAGGNYPSIDHLIPVSKGGSDTWDNVKLAHKSCNERRGAKKVDEWLADNPPILVGINGLSHK